MKLFVLLSRVPWPLDKGDKLRAYHQLQWLSKHHEIFLCCLSDEPLHPDALPQLRGLASHIEILPLNRARVGWNLIKAVLTDKPFQVAYFHHAHHHQRVQQWLHEFSPDHIYCQLVRTSEYVKHYHACAKTLDYMDAMSSNMRRRAESARWPERWLWRLESRRLLNYEHLIFDYFEHHTIISEQDKQLIYHPSRQKITVVQNGVDTNYFRPQALPREESMLLFTGNMSYPPNVTAAKRLVQRIVPLMKLKVKVMLAGAEPSQEVQSLGTENVTVTGRMADLREAYASATVFVAPMELGAGLQNKLLEAMAMGLPCVTTYLAANALTQQGNHALEVCDTDAEIAQRIDDLLNNATRRLALAQAARTFVENNYGWDVHNQNLERAMKLMQA